MVKNQLIFPLSIKIQITLVEVDIRKEAVEVEVPEVVAVDAVDPVLVCSEIKAKTV